ncbi:MAG TPA: YbaK/EbsC family protein [Candidatus Nanoarchaeia archaeon]|nr:YbaK/EbsC family protein [Candidatus Nanoarchaeia archaeon]
MNEYEEKLKEFMNEHQVVGEHLSFAQSCHSVAEAAHAAQAPLDSFVKNVCMIDSQGGVIVCIVKGEGRASTERVAKALGIERPRLATPDEILLKTGYPCGGTPSFGFTAQFLVDERVMEKDVVYTGGGSQNSLVKIAPTEILRVNSGKVVRIRK